MRDSRRIFRALVGLSCALFFAAMTLATPAQATPVVAAAAQDDPDGEAQAIADGAAEAIEDAAESAADDPVDPSSILLDPEIDLTELQHRLVPLTRAELNELASAWLGIVRDKTEEVMAAQIAIDRTEGEIEEQVRTELADQVFQRNLYFRKFTAILDAWEKKGGDAELIAEYRAYQQTVQLDELRTSELQTLMAEAGRWLTDRDGGIALAFAAAVVLVSILALLFVASIVRRIAAAWFARLASLSKLLQTFLATVIYWLVLGLGLIIVLSTLGVDVTPAFALIGGAAFILAFAFQDTLGNFASGLMIMINRPFDEGDVVDLDGVVGKVRSMTIVATTIVTPDNQLIVIPNRNVWGNLIKNMTAHDTRRVDLVFGISYGDSIDDALEVIQQVVNDHPAVLADPEPIIRVHELADSSVNFICRPWVKTDDYWDTYWDLTQRMKIAFDKRGISIPFPQRDVHVYETSRVSTLAEKEA
jgi:small conductance mechanosensitive channel